MQNTINAEAIKEGVNIIDLLQTEGFTVKNGFARSFINANDHTPSLKVYPNSNSWFDFSTGQGGDVIRLYELLHGVDFVTACKELQSNYLSVGATNTQTHPKHPQNHYKTKPNKVVDKPKPKPTAK